MMIQRFVSDLEAKVSDRVIEECKKMGAGQCNDIEDYAGRVGLIRGLNEAARLARELLKASTQDDDDEPSLRRIKMGAGVRV